MICADSDKPSLSDWIWVLGEYQDSVYVLIIVVLKAHLKFDCFCRIEWHKYFYNEDLKKHPLEAFDQLLL